MKIRVSGGFDPWFGPAPDYDGETELRPHTVALLGEDTPHLRPRFAVEEGTAVAAGDVLYADRRRPELSRVAPVSGTVTEIRRGPRRSFDRLVIAVNDGAPKGFAVPKNLSRASLTTLMIETGLWTGLRTRPFDRVPHTDQEPDALFVTAIDTRPLAPDPAAIIAPRADWFTAGLAALRLLTSGKTWLCHKAGAALPQVDGVVAAGFSGAHPAGLAGTHIHKLHPVGAGGMVWHIGYQEVLALGHLLSTGRIWERRVIGLAGNGTTQPALIATAPGADLHEICRGRLVEGPVRLMSGSPIDGRVGRYLANGHLQISVLRHAPIPERRNWLDHTVTWLRRGSGAILPTALHERAAPPGILAIPFLRAISVGDTESARKLGALELGEDDLALLGHVDGSADFGRMLRRVLDDLEATR
jgi:Na+-transporting NADH:ubiquinone oxidoreductase subunit A